MRELEKRISEVLPEGDWKIFQAMAYTPTAGGKRIRANVILRGSEDLRVGDLLDVAVAVELFHAGTLVHDDMPEIDDATMRRGKPACHLEFGPGVALLAGDGLFFLAFRLIANFPSLFGPFAKAAYDVLIGEAMDVEMEGLSEVAEKDIYEMYRLKTGALFGFSFSAPAYVAGSSLARELEELGKNFGVAFQIYDDLKDVLLSPEDIGKDTGKDVNKKTLVKALGIEESSKLADEIYEGVLKNLRGFGMRRTANYLEEIWDLIRRG